MIDAASNYLNHFTLAQPTSVLQQHEQQQQPQLHNQQQPTHGFINASTSSCNSNASSLLTLYAKQTTASTSHQVVPLMKMEMQYPPQASSTGSASPNSSISQSAASSASVSPSIFPSPAQSFASKSANPVAVGGTSPVSSSSAAETAAAAAADLGAAAVPSAAYSWNTATAYTSLPTRTQFPYAQYATDYYGNVATSASAAWFSHQERLYQPWSSQSYPSFNFDDIAFQTQLQRRSVRCTCPNCTNEMSGLPPIVGPDERGRKQHICHIPGCERLYGKASHLKTHLRWHTGERPFLCLTCGKRFSRSDELQRHGRTHTNYRPYACSICSKKFSRSDHLSKHKKTHFKEKKTKKSQVFDAKDQSAPIKQEKKTIKSKIMTTTMSIPVSGEQLKQEPPEVPSSLGYAPYINLYQQSAAASATVTTDLTSPPAPLFQALYGNRSRNDHWNNISSTTTNNNNNNLDSDQNQTTSTSGRPISVRSMAISKSNSSSSHTQHYPELAMQSESQLATEYGLTMSGLASLVSDSNNTSSCINSNGGYSSLIGPLKSEYGGSYPTELANSSGYGYAHHHHAAHTHHHHHNAWTTAYHPHATA